MKLRTKILLTVAAAVLFWAVEQFLQPVDHAAYWGRCEGLDIWYAAYNTEYFGERLPKNVVIDYSEKKYIAVTSFEDGHFHIRFNEKYAADPGVAHLFLLHEQCHIDTWSDRQDHPDARWRTCMTALDIQHAFGRIMIYTYDNAHD